MRSDKIPFSASATDSHFNFQATALFDCAIVVVCFSHFYTLFFFCFWYLTRLASCVV